MDISTFAHTRPKGWSRDAFPALDSERTLVTLFADPNDIDRPERIRELLEAYPAAHVIGCSTAGEIFDTSINDESLSVAVCRFDHTDLRSTDASVISAAESHPAGRRLGETLMSPDLKGDISVSDGVNVNG